MVSSSRGNSGSCWCGPCRASSSGVELHDGLLAQVAVRVGAPALDLSTHQRVEESHHAWILLDGLADVVVGQTAAAVEHQADVLLMGVEAAGLVLHTAVQVTETVGLLVGTPHLRWMEKQRGGMVEGEMKLQGKNGKVRFKVGQIGRQNDRVKNGWSK